MLSLQERLAVIDQSTEVIEVEGRQLSYASTQRIRDILWHNWALSELQVDAEIRAMVEEGLINEYR